MANIKLVPQLKIANKEVNSVRFCSNDHISRAYFQGSEKRYMQWFNNEIEGLKGIPEVALCDEKFIDSEEDYQKDKEAIFKLSVGQSLILGDKEVIITRVI